MKYYCNCWLCTKSKTKKAIAREKIDRDLEQWNREFASKQKPLDEEYAKILEENKWDLYER